MAQPSKPASGKNGDKEGAMRIDPALVRELAQLLTDNELTEIEVADGERRIKVKREAPAVISPGAAVAAPALSAPPMRGHQDIGTEPAVEEVTGTTVKC